MSKVQENQEGSKKPKEPSGQQRFMFQEYWVDFLGGLLPGALFSVTALYVLMPSAVLFINMLNKESATGLLTIITKIIAATRETPNMIWVGVSVILISLSYILGHIFYRQDPKVPNQRSLVRLVDKLAKKLNINRCCKRRLRKEFGCSSESDCEFPYRYFDEYLNYRGLKHLVTLAVWCKNKQHRTKNYINILKMRIRFYFPNHCATIIRNEAHVRLATSVWYVGKVIVKLSVLGALLLFAGIVIGSINGALCADSLECYVASTPPFVVALFTILSGGYLGYYLQSHIEDFLHYQRQREIVHVLEIAWTAFSDDPKRLNPPFKEYTGSDG